MKILTDSPEEEKVERQTKGKMEMKMSKNHNTEKKEDNN